jgi:hypothetical protein
LTSFPTKKPRLCTGAISPPQAAAGVFNLRPLPLREAQLPKRCPKAGLGRAGELFVELLGLEPGLQLLGGGAVLPLLAAGAAVEQYPTGE